MSIYRASISLARGIFGIRNGPSTRTTSRGCCRSVVARSRVYSVHSTCPTATSVNVPSVHKRGNILTVSRCFGSSGPESVEGGNERALAESVSAENAEDTEIPDPPTNCCMSGCANCVWIDYAHELASIYRDGGRAAERVMTAIEDPSLKIFLNLELKELKEQEEQSKVY